jgi:hypothetical protein
MNFSQMPELSRAEQREIARLFLAEPRRVYRQAGEVTVYRGKEVVIEAPQPAAPPAMSLPPCLCKPDTQAGIERRFAMARAMVQGARA